MKSHLSSLLKAIIGFPLTIIALFFIGRILISQGPTIVNNLHGIHIFLLIYGIISFILFYFLRSFIWYEIVKQYKITISFHESNYLWAISEVKRYIPGNIWSFLGRAVLFQQKEMQKKDIAKGLIIEAELFVMGSVLISLLALPYLFSKKQEGEALLLILLLTCLTVFYCTNRLIQNKFPEKTKKITSFLLPPFDPLENFRLVSVSTVALFFFSLGNYLVINSVMYLPLQKLFILIGVFAFAFVVGYLSVITPAGFGVREGIVIVILSRIMSSGLAAFAALFSRIILIGSEVLFILISVLWYKIRKPYVKRIETIIAKHLQVTILTALIAIYTLYFTIVSFLRYDNYYTGRFDLGNMAQTVWNSLHGRIFIQTDPNGTEAISRLAFHADFILVLLTPFYALWQNPEMLLLIQTVVVAAGAFFVYVIARDVLKNRNLALVFSFAYLLNPSIQRANIYDFHAVTLVTMFFLAAYYFFLKKRYKLFVTFVILAALCKEQIWLTAAFFGLLVFFVHKKKLIGAILFLFSIAMFYFLLWYAIPHTAGGQQFALAYLSDYGDSPTQVVKGIVLSPNKIIETLLEKARLGYFNQLFLPVGYLFIFFPFLLIFAAPDLLINTLSSNPQLHEIYYQYTATISPFIFLSAIYGVYWLRKIPFSWIKLSGHQWNFIIGLYLVAISIYGAYAFGPLPGSRDANLDMFIKQLPDQVYVDNFLQQIPKKDSVAASNDIGSHLSLRENIYSIPYGIDRADVVVLLLDGSDPLAKGVYAKVSKDPHYQEVANQRRFCCIQEEINAMINT